MKDSEVYLRAAKLVDGGMQVCSCDAICVADKYSTHRRYIYQELFKPSEFSSFIWGNEWSNDFSERKSCRVLALLFMHQIALDEERKRK